MRPKFPQVNNIGCENNIVIEYEHLNFEEKMKKLKTFFFLTKKTFSRSLGKIFGNVNFNKP